MVALSRTGTCVHLYQIVWSHGISVGEGRSLVDQYKMRLYTAFPYTPPHPMPSYPCFSFPIQQLWCVSADLRNSTRCRERVTGNEACLLHLRESPQKPTEDKQKASIVWTWWLDERTLHFWIWHLTAVRHGVEEIVVGRLLVGACYFRVGLCPCLDSHIWWLLLLVAGVANANGSSERLIQNFGMLEPFAFWLLCAAAAASHAPFASSEFVFGRRINGERIIRSVGEVVALWGTEVGQQLCECGGEGIVSGLFVESEWWSRGGSRLWCQLMLPPVQMGKTFKALAVDIGAWSLEFFLVVVKLRWLGAIAPFHFHTLPLPLPSPVPIPLLIRIDSGVQYAEQRRPVDRSYQRSWSKLRCRRVQVRQWSQDETRVGGLTKVSWLSCWPPCRHLVLLPHTNAKVAHLPLYLPCTLEYMLRIGPHYLLSTVSFIFCSFGIPLLGTVANVFRVLAGSSARVIMGSDVSPYIILCGGTCCFHMV